MMDIDEDVICAIRVSQVSVSIHISVLLFDCVLCIGEKCSV